MADDLLEGMKQRMEKSLKVLKEELLRVRTGRANPAIIKDVTVNYYGAPTPLEQIANITAPDLDLLVVRPYDTTQIEAVEKAILEADLGLNPADDGTIIRIKVPRLSEARRDELVKVVNKRGEETKVAIRNIRREINEQIEIQKRDGKISKDDSYRLQTEVNRITGDYTKQIDDVVAHKNQQIRTI
ncbi:MAG: ribosome recycling factor [Candidatus Bipolaricaulia bacterium]